MSVRDQDITERVARAEKDLVEFKGAQTFGKDVTRPKVIQRYNSDGTPTEWDVQGAFADMGGGFLQWAMGGQIVYKARNQDSPWASIYVKVRVNADNDILSNDGFGFSAYPDLEDIFSGSRTIRFNFDGAASPKYGTLLTSDPRIDRYWVKIYVLATDDGDLEIKVPFGYYGRGTLVPLT